MRQLGARLPEPPRIPETSRVPATHEPQPRLEPRSDPRVEQHIDFARDRSTGLEAVQKQEATPWGLLEPEREHRFPFLTVAVPGIAAVLALGALLWSGSLRDRVRQQDSAMNALQAQNQKLADTLEEMSVEQKASNALSSSTASQPSPSKPPAPAPPVHQQTPPARSGQTAITPEAQPQPAPQKTEPVQPSSVAKTETPPPQQATQEKAVAAQQEAQRLAKPAETAHSPQIVPPYPTNYRPLNATSIAAANNTPPQTASVYHPPFSVTSSNRSEPAPSAAVNPPARQTGTSTPPVLPTANHSGASPAQYNAAGNGLYASSLAENIEAVQGLQRHSTVPLQEFHVHEGMLTKVTPGLGLSVRHPDSGHGTYSLVVDGANGPYQLRGQVNNPLVFTDNTTHREYELVILRIAEKQVYGYVRAMR